MDLDRYPLVSVLLVIAGLAVAGIGWYIHLTVTTEVTAGQCDGCAPWHPLFVVTPLVLGLGLVLVGGYRLGRH